jgi:hypothetical protein
MRRPLSWLIATAGASLALAVLPVAALAAEAPSIEWTNAWNLTPNDATLGAGIDTHGLYTGYEFQIDTNASYDFTQFDCPFAFPGSAKCESITDGEPLPPGLVEPSPEYMPAGSGKQSVSLDLTSIGATLQPGTTYHYRVLASTGGQIVESPDQTFTTPLASKPSVESESVSHVTEHGATLEAKINSEELSEGAYYQFQVVKSSSEYLPELTCPEPDLLPPFKPDDCDSPDSSPHTPGALPIGYIAKGPEGQSVSLSLAAGGVTLQPDTTYHYRVLAAKRVQSEDGVDWQGPFAEGPDQTFTTLPAGTAPGAPVIESVSVSNLTAADATLEAQIDTEGQSTSYEFLLSYDPCPECEDFETVRIDLPSGLLLPSFQDQDVSLDLARVGVALHHSGEYEYSLRAINASGKTEARTQTFRVPPIVEPLSPTVTPATSAPTSGATGGGSQPTGSGGSSSTPLGTSAPGASSKTGAGTMGGKPRAKHVKHPKHKHHGTKAARRTAKGKKHKR